MAESRTEELQEATEITLGTGKLLGIFFGIAFLCAVFFSFGYMVGHSSSAGKPDAAASALTGNGPGSKPSASNKTPSSSQSVPPSPAPATSRDTSAPALVPATASQSSADKTNAA